MLSIVADHALLVHYTHIYCVRRVVYGLVAVCVYNNNTRSREYMHMFCEQRTTKCACVCFFYTTTGQSKFEHQERSFTRRSVIGVLLHIKINSEEEKDK